MTRKYFNFIDVLGYGWAVMTANLGFFVGVGLIWAIITYTPTVIQLTLRHLPLTRPTYWTLYAATTILGWIIAIVLGIGVKKIALSFCNEQKPPMGTLFDAGDCFWRYVGTVILYALIVLGGSILFIIPGIIWCVKFGLSFYFVIDKGLYPIEALRASSRTTMGVKWELFGFGILCGLINMLGLLCLIVGIFATYPVVIVASALVYRQLLAQTHELAEFCIPTPPSGPQPQNFPAE